LFENVAHFMRHPVYYPVPVFFDAAEQ